MSTHELLMARADAAIQSSKDSIALSQAQSRILFLEETIKNLKFIMIDNDIRCEECEGSLGMDELEYGMCANCARHFS